MVNFNAAIQEEMKKAQEKAAKKAEREAKLAAEGADGTKKEKKAPNPDSAYVIAEEIRTEPMIDFVLGNERNNSWFVSGHLNKKLEITLLTYLRWFFDVKSADDVKAALEADNTSPELIEMILAKFEGRVEKYNEMQQESHNALVARQENAETAQESEEVETSDEDDESDVEETSDELDLEEVFS